jgi:glycosyltransferase involved in cell wall biosynthesis
MISVSIIVPIYNVEVYLRRCLDSLLRQTFTDIEIICVIDGPTDQSGMIAKQYAKRDTRIVIIEQPNCGVSVARNIALSKATGEYISFIDGDDWVAPNFVETLYNAAITTGSGMVICNFQKVQTNIREDNISYTSGIFDGRDICRELISGKTLKNYPWNKLYKKELFDKHGIIFPIDIKFAEDYAVMCQLAYYAGKVNIINEYLYYYRIHDTSTTRIYNLHRVTGLLKAFEVIKNFLKQENIYESYQVVYEYS